MTLNHTTPFFAKKKKKKEIAKVILLKFGLIYIKEEYLLTKSRNICIQSAILPAIDCNTLQYSSADSLRSNTPSSQ